MEQAVQLLAAISFLVIGLSHLFRPGAWVAYFQALAALGTPGVFLDGLLNLAFGALIVAFHNVWRGPELSLTLLGCGLILKGAGRLLAPGLGLRALQHATPERAWQFRAGGLLSLAISGWLWYLRYGS